jgi:hypothetical protein
MWCCPLLQFWRGSGTLCLSLSRMPKAVRLGIRHFSAGASGWGQTVIWTASELVAGDGYRTSPRLRVLWRLRVAALARKRGPVGDDLNQSGLLGHADRYLRCDTYLDSAQTARHVHSEERRAVSWRAAVRLTSEVTIRRVARLEGSGRDRLVAVAPMSARSSSEPDIAIPDDPPANHCSAPTHAAGLQPGPPSSSASGARSTQARSTTQGSHRPQKSCIAETGAHSICVEGKCERSRPPQKVRGTTRLSSLPPHKSTAIAKPIIEARATASGSPAPTDNRLNSESMKPA